MTDQTEERRAWEAVLRAWNAGDRAEARRAAARASRLTRERISAVTTPLPYDQAELVAD